eukprot:600957-Prymnesium_polylepis.1
MCERTRGWKRVAHTSAVPITPYHPLVRSGLATATSLAAACAGPRSRPRPTCSCKAVLHTRAYLRSVELCQ